MMAVGASAPSAARIADKAIRQQIERVLASKTFQRVDRLKRFLHFIGFEALAGHSGELKEYVIGVQVFGKEASFDPRMDPIVRVQARRLRARLVRYYRDEGHADEIVIELPKGGYAPVFRHREGGAPPRRTLGAALASRNTIAVQPFADHSAAHDLEYFCDGLRQEIVHSLATVKGLRVHAWRSSPDHVHDPTSEAITPINPGFLVTGSVRAAGDRIRVTTQLVDGTNGCYLWSDSVDALLSDPFVVQERVARALADKLQSEFLEPASTVRAQQSTENLAAHNLYVQGRYHLDQRTEEGLQRAVEFFERALVEDAQFALAHSGLADAHGLLTHYGVVSPPDTWTRAASGAASAVALAGSSAEAHTSLAHVKSTQDWDWPGAEHEFRRAIGLNPRYPTAHHWYAMSCLVPMGRLDEALDRMLMAQSLDPVSCIIARDVAVVHVYRRDFESALEQCDHTIALNPHFGPAYLTLGLIQEQRQDFDESAAAIERAARLSPQTPRMHSALARTSALSGKREVALEMIRKLEGLARTRYVSPFEFALIRTALGQLDLAFKWLTKAVQDRCFELLALKVDPRFDPLKTDRRFDALTGQIGLG